MAKYDAYLQRDTANKGIIPIYHEDATLEVSTENELSIIEKH